MSEKKWTDEDVTKMAQRAAELVDREIRAGSFGSHYNDNAIVMECVGEALGSIESSIEWVLDEISEGSWNPLMGIYAPHHTGGQDD